MAFAIDSNSTQAYYGQETALGVQSAGPWFPFEPNSYSTWGLDNKTVQRELLNISRQQSKGTVTEKDVTAGLQTDLTQNNISRLLQGFFFANVIEKAKTQTIAGVTVAVASVSTTAYTLASAVTFTTNHLVFAQKFAAAANNGPMLVSGVAGAVVTAAPLRGGATVVDAAPAAAASLTAIGFQLSTSAALAGLTTGPTTITDTGGVDFTTLGLTPGEWLYVGDIGNAISADNFNFTGTTSALTVRGYGRISAIAATVLTFDFVTFGNAGDTTATTTAGVRIWFGDYLANQTTISTIIRRSYTLPRYLGKGIGGADQLEVLLGCVPNKLTLNIPTANKATVDLTFVGIDANYANETMLTGTINPAFNEFPYNTSQDIFNCLLTVNGQESTSLFAYAQTAAYDLDNGAEVARAIGSAAGFDVTVGDFKAAIKATVYFNDIGAIEAIQNNADVGYTTIFAARNAGQIWDVPLLTLGGGLLKLEKNKKIMVDLTGDGSAAALNYTASNTKFYYLPDSAISGYTGL